MKEEKNDGKEIVVTLPALPKKWDDLKPEQIIEICRIQRSATKGAFEAMFLILCYLLDIKMEKNATISKDFKRWEYWFHQNDKEKRKLKFKLTSQWFVNVWESCLTWMNQTEPCTRTIDVLPEITLFGKKYTSPGDRFVNMTYEQHQCLQSYSQVYYSCCSRMYRIAEKKQVTKDDVKDFEECIRDREKYRRRVMACIYTPESKISSKVVDGVTVHYDPPKTQHIFTSGQIEEEAENFRAMKEEQSDAVMLLYSGVMLQYKKMYPLLFKESEGGYVDYVKVEESTMNALQNKLHFSNYQTIKDANAFYILGELNAILQEAKSIEEMNAKMKVKH